jgi:hypothetical protein
MLLLKMLTIEFKAIRWHKEANRFYSHMLAANVITTSTTINAKIALNKQHHLLHITPHHDCKSIFQEMGKLERGHMLR